MLLTPYTTYYKESNGDIILFNWMNNESVVLFEKKHPVYNFIENGFFPSNIDSEYKDDIDYLIEKNFLYEDGGLYPANEVPLESSDILRLILLPSGYACNLSCVYCYEDHDTHDRMGDEHIRRIILLCKKSNAKLIHLDYFGGEPLLNITFIENLAEEMRKEGIPFFASATTNATLITEYVLDRLYNSGLRSFQITLDGPELLHNNLRRSLNEKFNSFTKVVGALKTIQESNFKISVVVRTNANETLLKNENLLPYLDTITSTIPVSDKRFSFLIKPIGDYASANNKQNDGHSYCKHDKTSFVVSSLENELQKLGYTLTFGQMLAQAGGLACYAGSSNCVVIGTDYSIYKCTVAFEDPINKVGFLDVSGDMILNENYALWTKNFSDGECYFCFMKRTCKGKGCPLNNIKKNKKICSPMKYNSMEATRKVFTYLDSLEENCE